MSDAKMGWSSSIQLASEAKCNKGIARLQLVGPVEVPENEIKELDISNIEMVEMIVLKQKKLGTRGGVINPSVKEDVEVLKRTFVEEIGPNKGSENGEVIRMGGGSQKISEI